MTSEHADPTMTDEVGVRDTRSTPVRHASGWRTRLEPATLIVAIAATLALVTSSGVGDHYFGALMIDRVSRTTWLLAIVAIGITIIRPVGRRTPDGRAQLVVLVPTAIGLIVVATWAVRTWADGAAPPWVARFVVSSMAKADETRFGPGVGALLVLVALAVALGSPQDPGRRNVVTAGPRLGWLVATTTGAAALVVGMLLPAGEYRNGTVGSRLLLEVPGSGPLLAAAIASVFLAALALRSLDPFDESHLSAWQIGVGVAGLASHPAALVLDGPPVVPVAPWFTLVGSVLTVLAGVWFRRAGSVPDLPAAGPGDERSPASLVAVVAASFALAFLVAPWRRQAVPSSGAGDVVSVDRGVDLMAGVPVVVLALLLVGSVALVSNRLMPTDTAVRSTRLAAAGAGIVGIVVGTRSVVVLLDGDHIGRFGGDRVLWATVGISTLLAATAASAAAVALLPRRIGWRSRIVLGGLAGSATVVAVGAALPGPERLAGDVLLRTEWDAARRATVELGASHGSVSAEWELLHHREVPLITDANGAIYEVLGGRPHLATPFDAGFSADLLVAGDSVVVDGQNLEMVPLGAGRTPSVLSSPLEVARLTVVDGAWWIETQKLTDGPYEPLIALVDRVVSVTDEPIDPDAFTVPLHVEPRPAGGLRLTPSGGEPLDVLIEIDPACDVLRDGPTSFGRVVDVGSVVDGEAIVAITDGDGAARIVRLRADGFQDELLVPAPLSPDIGHRAPLGAAIIDDRPHLAVGGDLLVVEDLDVLASPLPAEHPADCIRRGVLPTPDLTPIVEVPRSAYVPHLGPFDPTDFAYFSGRGTGFKLIEVVDGRRTDLGGVPASRDRVEHGPFDVDGELVMVVTDDPERDDGVDADDMFLALVPVGVDPDSVGTETRIPAGGFAGVVPLPDRAIVAVGSGLYTLGLGIAPTPLVRFDADIATIAGDGGATIHALLETGELHRIDGVDDGDVTTTLLLGTASTEASDKPIEIQLQLSDDPFALEFAPTDASLDETVDLAVDGEDVLVLIETALVRLHDGRVEAVGSTAELDLAATDVRDIGALRSGVDGPLWVTPGRISSLHIAD